MTLEDSIMASSALMNVLAEKSEDSGLKMLTSHTLHNLDSDLLEFSKALNLPAMEQVNSEVAS